MTPGLRNQCRRWPRSRSRTRPSTRRSATGVREDGAFIEAGENDNLIVQKLAANPNTLGFFGYSFLEENPGKLKGVVDQRRRPDLRDDQQLQISGRAAALHLHQERPRQGDPGGPRLCRRIHQGKRVRAQRLSAPRRPDRRAERDPRHAASRPPAASRRSTSRRSNSTTQIDSAAALETGAAAHITHRGEGS